LDGVKVKIARAAEHLEALVEKDRPIADGEVIGKIPFPAESGQKWRIGVQTRLGLQETKAFGSLESLSLFGIAKQLLDYVQDIIVPEFEQFFE
jgi:hypothetical protein